MRPVTGKLYLFYMAGVKINGWTNHIFGQIISEKFANYTGLT